MDDCDETSKHHRVVKVAAIGPTTETFLTQTLKLSVSVTARNPTAEGLADEIFQYDEAR